MTDEPRRASEDAPPTPDPDTTDLGRRTFFRHLGRNAVRAAGNAVGTASAIRSGSVAAAGGLFGFGFEEGPTVEPAPFPPPSIWTGRSTSSPTDEGTHAGRAARLPFRSPYRLDGDLLILVDQWRLPDEVVQVACADARDLARAMADFVVRGAPVLAQVAAYGIALSVRAARALTPDEREAVVSEAAAQLVATRPSVQPVAYAAERMLARWDAVREKLDLDQAADAMRTEADAIASESQIDHARIARFAAAALPSPPGRPLGLLVHGNAGALAGGNVGTVLGVVQRLVADGRAVHVWATESRPSLDGTRLTALELARTDAPFTLIPDATAGWVLANEPIDAVLLGAESIAANGDTAFTVGSLPIAAVAAARDVRVLVCAPSATIGLRYPDGGAIPVEHDTQGEPLLDVVPGPLVSALFTEDGHVVPTVAEQLRAAYQRSAQRRLPHGRGDVPVPAATPPTPATPTATLAG
jgi:methylthioribose-1-phosphate isomerase